MSLPIATVIAGLAAFISLSYEILWYRMLDFVSGDVASIFGLLLAFYLGGLAGGALLVGRICQRSEARSGGSPWIGVALFIGVANLLGYVVAPLLGRLAQAGAWPLALP